MWGSLVLDRTMGVAAGVLVDEYDRRCREFGEMSREVSMFTASELGFEHNLGLLHKAHCDKREGILRSGIPEVEYYLERCLLEAEGCGLSLRANLMCASIVGQSSVDCKHKQMFGRSVSREPYEMPPVPELWLHPATTVGAEPDVKVENFCEGVSEATSGYCYLALIKPEHVSESAEMLGPNPTLRDLVAHGQAGRFRSDAALGDLRFKRTPAGYHVQKSRVGLTLLEVTNSLREVGGLLERSFAFVGADAPGVLCGWLSGIFGSHVVLSDSSLELVTSSAALLDRDKKTKLRSLEALGDAVLSMMIARDNYLGGHPVERYQTVRSDVTSNKRLADKFAEHVPVGAVSFPQNVNPNAGVVGAKALEAIFGAIWLDLGDESLSLVLRHMGFVAAPLRTSDLNLPVGQRCELSVSQLFRAFHADKQAVADAEAYQVGDSGHKFVTPGIQHDIAFTDWFGACLAADGTYMLVGNRASFSKNQYALGRQAGMAMVHLMVIPIAKWYNAVSLGDSTSEILHGMRKFFRIAWGKEAVRDKVYQHQRDRVEAARNAGGSVEFRDVLRVLDGHKDELLSMTFDDF